MTSMDYMDEPEQSQLMEAFQGMATLLSQNRSPLQLGQAPKRHRGPPQAPESQPQTDLVCVVRLLISAVTKMDRELNSMHEQDSFVFFMAREDRSILGQLFTQADNWNKMKLEAKANLRIPTLRTFLMRHVAQELQNRVLKVHQSDAQHALRTAAVQKGILLSDNTWPFLNWCHQQKKLILAPVDPVSPKKMEQLCQGLIESLQNEEVVIKLIKFHSLRPRSNQDAVVPWRLQVSLRQAEAWTLLGHGQQRSVATPGLHNEGSFPSAVCSLPETSVHDQSGQGQGQGQGEDQAGQVNLSWDDLVNEPRGSMLQTNETADALRGKLANLVFTNETNWCFANTAMLTLLWSLLSNVSFSMGDLGTSQALLLALMNSTEPVSLCKLPWFADLLKTWHDTDRQHDAAEFTCHLVTHLGLRLPTDWEKRLMTENGMITADLCAVFQPINLQLPVDSTHVRLQDLVDSWTQENGMQTALMHCPDLLCLRIDRMFKSLDGVVNKLHTGVGFFPGCDIPNFDNCSDLDTTPTGYLVVAALMHLGSAEGGHYRCLLRCGLRWNAGNQMASWLLTDDNSKPQIVNELPYWIYQHVNVIWLSRQDVTHLFPSIWNHVTVSEPSLLNLLAES